MTVAVTTRKAGPFVGNGATTSFPFTFKVFATTDIVATLKVIATGVQTVLVLDAVDGYTVTLNGDQDASPGGSVTYNPSGTPMASTHNLTLTSAVPQSQSTTVSNGGGFFPAVLNAVHDRAVILIADLAEKLGRTFRIPVSDSTTLNDLPDATGRASGFFAFDASGQPIIATGMASAPATAFGASLIDDANAAAARTTLGLGTIATQDASAVAITGGTMGAVAITTGTINNTPIGGTTKAAGGFTTLTATGLLDISAAGAGQISFPATQNASAGANVLDDYEKGTWTIAITFGGGATGLTYTSRSGTYLKIGDQVSITCECTINAEGSSSGSMEASGLPFTVAAPDSVCALFLNGYSGITVPWCALPIEATTTMRFFFGGGNGSVTAFTEANTVNGCALRLSTTYFV